MKPRVLIACEFSGVVRRAFRAIGFDAWSCDLLPAEDGDKHHIQGDVENHLEDGWHGMIAHPPCTRLTVAGARWFKGREAEQAQAIRFVEDCARSQDAARPKPLEGTQPHAAWNRRCHGVSVG